MSGKVKAAIITGVFALLVGIIGTFTLTNVINNNVSVVINGTEVKINPGKLQSMYDDLKSQYETLKVDYDDLKNNRTPQTTRSSMPIITSKKEISLSAIPLYNCKYFDRGSWVSSELFKWNEATNKAADGNSYKDVVYLALHGNWSGHAQIINIEYLFDKKYSALSCKYMLDERSKSTTSIAVMRLYD